MNERTMRVIEPIGGRMGQDLGALWREAERLGCVEVDWEIFGEEYKAQIRFQRASGSIVMAAGKSKIIEQAVATAIQEARELGAG